MESDDNRVVLEVTSVEHAMQLMGAITDDHPFPDEIRFSGDIACLRVSVTGEIYHSTVPGYFARGLWGYQEAIYRAVAIALYGSDDLRRLTKEEFQKFNLVFNVSEGSSSLEAGVSGFLTALGQGLSNMSDGKKLAAILGVAAILASAWGASEWKESDERVRIEETRAEQRVEEERLRQENQARIEIQKTEQMKAILGQHERIVSAFFEANVLGAKQLVKSAPDAEAVRVGHTHFDRGDIIELNSRSSRETSEWEAVRQSFMVIGFRRPEGAEFVRFTLASAMGEIPAVLDMSEEGGFSRAQIDHLWNAARNQTPVLLVVQAKYLGGQIKQAFVVDIPMDMPPAQAVAVADLGR